MKFHLYATWSTPYRHPVEYSTNTVFMTTWSTPYRHPVEYSTIQVFMTMWSTPYRHPVEYSTRLYIWSIWSTPYSSHGVTPYDQFYKYRGAQSEIRIFLSTPWCFIYIRYGVLHIAICGVLHDTTIYDHMEYSISPSCGVLHDVVYMSHMEYSIW